MIWPCRQQLDLLDHRQQENLALTAFRFAADVSRDVIPAISGVVFGVRRCLLRYYHITLIGYERIPAMSMAMVSRR